MLSFIDTGLKLLWKPGALPSANAIVSATMDPTTRSRLEKLFSAVTQGKRGIKNSNEAGLFLESISIQQDRAQCIEKLVGSSHGLLALRTSLRFDVSSTFINKSSAPFILYVSDDSVRQLCGGQLLHDVLKVVMDPPTFWEGFERCVVNKTLSHGSLMAFANLLCELLLSRPNLVDVDYFAGTEKVLEPGIGILDSCDADLRSVGYKLQDLVRRRNYRGGLHGSERPGGRHDNDFEDFVEISIFPTLDELLSKKQPYYLLADVVFETPSESRAAAHLDNQFRLLREDMLADLRLEQDKSTRKSTLRRFSGLTSIGINQGSRSNMDTQQPSKRFEQPTLALSYRTGIPALRGKSQSQKMDYLSKDKEGQKILKHKSFGCLLVNGTMLAFAKVQRNVARLCENPPILLLEILGDSAWTKVLVSLKTVPGPSVDFVSVDTPIFAYEPILSRLQEIRLLPLSDQLLGLKTEAFNERSDIIADDLVHTIEQKTGKNLRNLLQFPMDIILDQSQTESLVAGLSFKTSLIQGPPGTGKSFIGAILSKAIHDYSQETILVITFTNHALDQFLEEIMDMGVDPSEMLRLGSHFTQRTEPLSLYKQSHKQPRTQDQWNLVNKYRDDLAKLQSELHKADRTFKNLVVSPTKILELLEFSDADQCYFEALSTPEGEDGWNISDGNGNTVGRSYLIERWQKGEDAGVLKDQTSPEHLKIWDMPVDERREVCAQWIKEFLNEQGTILLNSIQAYSETLEQHHRVSNQKNDAIFKNRRIVACTTTAAAMYSKEIQMAKPSVIIVEEAGEILESHILTAMSSSTRQLVLIGDHKQLRPKANHFPLSVEKGDGYDLNRSLFERLVLAGYPHTTLTKQHRMRPEISALVRNLTYPELEDAEKTLQRPVVRGLQSSVVFFNHEQPEKKDSRLADRRDEGSKVSKQNEHEAEMVLKTVRYLAQQGYGTDKQVVLTPYLGQLSLIMRKVRDEARLDPVLGDLDSFDLVRAGLVTPASAHISSRRLRMSTIDNYQGEESDIVIISLTRSNSDGDVGFLHDPKRVNVLLSRARIGLILIGNAGTFLKSRKGAKTWGPLIEQLREGGYFHDGLPVKCERHPEKTAILNSQEAFQMQSPDGGCTQECGITLSCGKHPCPQKCHQILDHSKMKCLAVIKDVCSRNHSFSWVCWRQISCPKCEAEARKLKLKQERDHRLDETRLATEQSYIRRLAVIDLAIDEEQRKQKDIADEVDRTRHLEQRQKDLATIRDKTRDCEKGTNQPSESNHVDDKSQAPAVEANSKAKVERDLNTSESAAAAEWDRQKRVEGAENEHLDALMGMIGLESVKQQALDTKIKIDTLLRQGASTKGDRFGASFLGNPGTGKTTVARLYARFLASVGVIPGDLIKETTGAALASDGVQACKKLIEEILNAGGGALFVDEAYQLTSGNSFGGGAVLDYLLAEVENLTGKVIFLLAGYNKQMEKFFAHNPGLPSRFPQEFQFRDYEDEELSQIFEYQITKRFDGKMKAESGMDGLYCRIVARRIGYGRGKEGFGNARAVENQIKKITTRQAKRLQQDRKSGNTPDDFLLTKEDLIGPEPSQALAGNKPWTKLKTLIGLDAVKESIESLLESIQFNYQRELDELPLVEFSLNRVFLGSPGTGKTTVAKLYGQVLADIGFLSNGEVVVKNPADFVGDVLGASEKTTKGILASTVGKVLVIDEAYGLCSGSGSNGSQSDPFKTAVIDTLVAEVQSVPGDDRCVLLLGYKDQMEAMMQSVNPGLSRRFPISEAFEFEDFNDAELEKILALKLKIQAYGMTDQARKVAMEMLKRARNRPNFGNAGEVDILLNGAKARHQKRRTKSKTKDSTLQAVDMDPDFDRGTRGITNIRVLFKDVVGCDELVQKFEGYQKTVANMKARNMDPVEQIPFSFLFKGPPGTGKTTTARKMGKIYYDMGFLAHATVMDHSATDLIGQYVGHTGRKTQKLLESALGKVLFIDEAYRLAGGQFADEAINELVDCLTKPAFANKLIVILAGYDHHIDKLMSINPGLTSRFPETILFKAMHPKHCFALLQNLLRRRQHLNTAILDLPSIDLYDSILTRFNRLVQMPNWGSARDVGTVSKNTFNKVLKTADPESKDQLQLEEEAILTSLDEMILERQDRAKAVPAEKSIHDMLPKIAQPNAEPGPISRRTRSQTSSAISRPEPKVSAPDIPPPPVLTEPSSGTSDVRDVGISDEVWHRLQEDKAAAAARENEHKNHLKREHELKAEHAKQAQQEEKAAARALEEEQQREQKFKESLTTAKAEEVAHRKAKDDEEKLRRERERIQYELARRRREEELAQIERQKHALEQERRKEAVAQQKLREMGVCCAGFRWIKQMGGYRCAGGSHYVSDAQLGF